MGFPIELTALAEEWWKRRYPET